MTNLQISQKLIFQFSSSTQKKLLTIFGTRTPAVAEEIAKNAIALAPWLQVFGKRLHAPY